LADYDRLKAALLQEFKLSANVYLESFNSICKGPETYVAFLSKIEGLLKYYLESRQVDDFDKLSELLVCDRIKSTLSESCLRYVLSIESANDVGWLSLQSLTESIDRYLPAHSAKDKPKAYAIGQNVHKTGHVSTGSLNKPFQSGFASNGKKFSMENGGTGANFKGNGRTDANPSINFGPGPTRLSKCNVSRVMTHSHQRNSPKPGVAALPVTVICQC